MASCSSILCGLDLTSAWLSDARRLCLKGTLLPGLRGTGIATSACRKLVTSWITLRHSCKQEATSDLSKTHQQND
jgi:hypothetical protein